MEHADAWHMTEKLHHELGRGDPFAAAMRATRMPMLITDPRQPDNPIVFANDAFLALTGYGREEILGENCRFLQGEGTDPAAVAEIRDAIAAGRDVSIDILNYRKDGSPFWNALYISPVITEAGEPVFFFASQLDISDRKERELKTEDEKRRFEHEVGRRTEELRAALADRQRANDELKAALDAKTVLLHEVDHRVKNNLQMISAMLAIQSRDIPDPAIRESLSSMLERVQALSTVHRRLYQSEDVSRFDVGEFARDLVHDLVGATGRGDIDVRLDLEPVSVPAEKAAPIALIVNELVTNSLKHAFVDERPGTVEVAVKRREGRLQVRIADDGVGMPGEPLGPKSFGRTLVATLARQLRASAEWRAAEPSGTRVEITLPIEMPAPGE